MECKCENIGNAIPDIAGVGIILAFAILAELSLVFAGIGYYVTLQAGSEDQTFGNEWDEKRARFFRSRRVDVAEKVLGSISEVQLFNGIALLIAAMVQRNSLSLYHFHVVYDTVNFTAVSFTASIFVVWISQKIKKQNGEEDNQNGEEDIQNSTHRKTPHIRWVGKVTTTIVSTSVWIVIFCILYLVYVILFGIALARWDVDKFGYCYRDQGIASPDSQHPEVDHVYLGITSLYMLALLHRSYRDSHGIAWSFYSRWPISVREKYGSFIGVFDSHEKLSDALESLFNSIERGVPISIKAGIARLFRAYISELFMREKLWTERAIVFLSLSQYLLHLYMVWAIRSANRMHLQSESEDSWGFGQVVALIQILPVLKGCTRDCIDYRTETAKWLKKNPEGGHTRMVAIVTGP